MKSRDSQVTGVNHEASRLPGQPHHICDVPSYWCHYQGWVSQKEEGPRVIPVGWANVLTLKTL